MIINILDTWKKPLDLGLKQKPNDYYYFKHMKTLI